MAEVIYRVYWTVGVKPRLYDYSSVETARIAARQLSRRPNVRALSVVRLTTSDGWQTGNRDLVPF